ncbi:hypothetical protein ccbrp13_56460 [Ktedonobacteria bacterium brp13]|nr:hypothetical protein ccbrp13_56460 [Ktedonobacteria bacterium brp13]
MTTKFPTYSIKGREVEYKTFSFQLKSFNEDEGTITGYLSTFGNVDLQKDRVVRGAFKKTIQEAYSRKQNGRKYLFAMLWMHDPEQPIGGFTEAEETPEGLLVTAELDISTNAAGIPNNPKATMVFSGFKCGYVDEMSMGYLPIQKEFEGGIRNLKECALLEGSGVTMLFAANPEALVPASGVKNMAGTQPQRKDFNDVHQAGKASDCLEDWGDLLNDLTQAMFQIFGMSDSPEPDMADCLKQFGDALTSEWLPKAIESDLGQYLNDRGYCNASTSAWVPGSMQVGSDYGYMSRSGRTASKVGATISSATQGTLESHQAEMKASLDAVAGHIGTMQKKVSDLTQLWSDEGQGPAYADDKDDGKSRMTRREPLSPALSRQGLQPLTKSTDGDLSIDDLAALLV